MKHTCREMERAEELRGPVGQAAYAHYCDWMKAKKRSVQTIETFSSSVNYNAFVAFAKRALKTHIPNTSQFIKIMVEHGDVPPSLWCRDNVYAMYLEWYDKAMPPEGQFITSLDFVNSLVEEYACEKSEIFEKIPLDTLITYIKRRKITPWFLLPSRAYRTFQAKLPAADREKLNNALGTGAMLNRIKSENGLFSLITRAAIAEGY